MQQYSRPAMVRGWPPGNAAVKIDSAAVACRGQRKTSPTSKAKERPIMPIVTWDHVHLRSPDPEATAAWLEDVLGGVIIRGPGRIDVKLGGANVFIAPVTAGARVPTPPAAALPPPDTFCPAPEGSHS